jgi:hypothetical protein
MASINFNANDVPESEDKFELIPAGDYKAIILESSIKATKAGTGEYVAVKVQIVDGEKKGRTVFANLNFKNPNPTAQQIGQRELADLTKAVGLVTLTDTAQLHGKPLTVRIGIEPAKDGYDAANRVKKWLPINQASTPEVITMPSAKSAGAKPWEV